MGVLYSEHGRGLSRLEFGSTILHSSPHLSRFYWPSHVFVYLPYFSTLLRLLPYRRFLSLPIRLVSPTNSLPFSVAPAHCSNVVPSCYPPVMSISVRQNVQYQHLNFESRDSYNSRVHRLSTQGTPVVPTVAMPERDAAQDCAGLFSAKYSWLSAFMTASLGLLFASDCVASWPYT